MSRSVALLGAASLLALVGCASAPPTHLHSLMPEASTGPAPSNGLALRPIVLEPIALPAQVDTPQWIVRLPDDTLAALEQERWASPLRDEMRQALLERFANRYALREPRARTAGETSPVRIAVNVRRFDSIPGREAMIEGDWVVTASASPSAAPVSRQCAFLFRQPASGGFTALASAQRALVARLGDAIAPVVRDPSAPCPAVVAEGS